MRTKKSLCKKQKRIYSASVFCYRHDTIFDMKHIHPLVIGNWKMNPLTVTEAKSIFTSIKTAGKKFPSVQVVIAPPALYLVELQKLAKGSPIALGAQTIHEAPVGAQTGEQSIGMVMNAGATYTILGHSERRALGETDEQINRKVQSSLKARITAIVCIGEKERDNAGNFYTLIESQIGTALATVPGSRLKDIVVAYEPIWAIGTGKTASVDDVFEMQLFIKKTIIKLFGKSGGAKVRIIYGGSVNAENAATLFKVGGVAGFLVGGASLKPADFTKIIAATT